MTTECLRQLKVLLIAGLMLLVYSKGALAEELSQTTEFNLDDLRLASESLLQELRGGHQDADSNVTVQSLQNMQAMIEETTFSAESITSGAVTFEQHALDGFNGIGLFNIVTGNNNAVNAAIGVTFNLQ